MVTLAPDVALSHETLGLVAAERHDWPSAEAQYRRALALDPLSWSALSNLGVVLQRRGRQREAIECFAAALRLDPTRPLVRANLQRALRHTRR
jgi:Flp pilus assembly protein TadD